MTIRTIGTEFKKFYSDTSAWPKGVYHEDEEITVDGDTVDYRYDLSRVPDNATIVLADGYVLNLPNGKDISFEQHFKNWKKRQMTSTLVVECPLDKLEAVTAAIKAAGGLVR